MAIQPTTLALVVALAFERPADRDVPLSRDSLSELKLEVTERSYRVPITWLPRAPRTIWRLLTHDALRPWRYRCGGIVSQLRAAAILCANDSSSGGRSHASHRLPERGPSRRGPLRQAAVPTGHAKQLVNAVPHALWRYSVPGGTGTSALDRARPAAAHRDFTRRAAQIRIEGLAFTSPAGC
jgi:hypothetical protein